MNRHFCREVLDCASPRVVFDGPGASESGRGLPQSKTLRPQSRRDEIFVAVEMETPKLRRRV